ncbi:hypothetical protein ACNOYE_28315 [Nannocystaceae bacterium ST9]
MLDAFEARLIEVLGEGLASVDALSVVARARDGLAEPTGAQVQLRVRLLDARPQAEVGDDERARLRQGSDWRRRITLRLEGEVELGFRIGLADPSQRGQQRERLVQVVDRALILLADEAVRSGHAFRADTDRGFELDGFRLLALEAPREREDGGGEGRTFTLRCRYAGRFWPVGEEQAGVAIRELPVRQVVLPIGLPTNLRAKAGAEIDIELSVEIGLLQIGAAALPEPTIIARLLGASPGELLGVAEPGAPGWVRFPLDAARANRYVVRYRAPAAVSGKAEARIALGVARAEAARIDLGTLKVEVHE